MLFFYGMGAGIVLAAVFGYLISDKKQEPFPLNPELVRYWEESLRQKDSELTLLGEIRDSIKETPMMKKTEEEIRRVLDNLPPTELTKFSAMTYEAGIEETLLWVLGELSDDDFEYCKEAT